MADRKSFSDLLDERRKSRQSRDELEAAATGEPMLRDHPVYGKYFKMHAGAAERRAESTG